MRIGNLSRSSTVALSWIVRSQISERDARCVIRPAYGKGVPTAGGNCDLALAVDLPPGANRPCLRRAINASTRQRGGGRGGAKVVARMTAHGDHLAERENVPNVRVSVSSTLVPVLYAFAVTSLPTLRLLLSLGSERSVHEIEVRVRNVAGIRIYPHVRISKCTSPEWNVQ